MRTVFIIFLLFFHVMSKSQDKPELFDIYGEHTVQWYQQKESKKEAQDRAEKFARINALEREFGTVIIQGNSTYIRNVSTGQQVETKTTFNMIGNTVVGGEIIKVTNLKFTENKKKYRRGKEKVEDIFITCIVEGQARKLSNAAVDFSAAPLYAPNSKALADRYFDGDDMFFYFKSPVSGFVSIYVDITGLGKTQRILPYSEIPTEYENGMPVKADKEYIFFSSAAEHDYFAEKYVVPDEIIASCNEEQEHWRIFMIFTKKPLNKPALRDDLSKEQLTEAEKEDNYDMPKELDSESFQRWMVRSMSFRADFQRKIIDVTVQKK